MASRTKEEARLYSIAYRAKNKDKIKQARAQYYADNREVILTQKKEYTRANKIEYDTQYKLNNGDKIKKYQLDYYVKHRAEQLAKKKQYHEDNKEKNSIKWNKYYALNSKKCLAQKQQYRQENKGKINALNAARKIYIKQRTPVWVDSEELWLIKEVYSLAALRTKMFGFSWHVDHIVPLQGKLVSGLHAPENMRVIPAVDNLKKKNKFEVTNGF